MGTIDWRSEIQWEVDDSARLLRLLVLFQHSANEGRRGPVIKRTVDVDLGSKLEAQCLVVYGSLSQSCQLLYVA